MHRRIISALVISACFCAMARAQPVPDSPDTLVQKLSDPNPRLRMVAADRLALAIDPDKGMPPPDADALKAKLAEFYKTHRTS
jgi:hypothetical protein